MCFGVQGSCSAGVPPKTKQAQHIPQLCAPLRPLKNGQCLLWTDAGLLAVNNSPLWLEGLYVRQEAARRGISEAVIYATGTEAKVYMSEVRLQGDGDNIPDCEDCGMVIEQGAALYAEGTFPY